MMTGTLFPFRTLRGLTIALLALLAPSEGTMASEDGPYRLEVREGWHRTDGRHVAAIDIRLAEGWKTYWRVPGAAGIPPSFRWRRRENVARIEIAWPRPRPFVVSGLESIGYKHRLVLPLIVTPENPSKPVRLEGEIDFGVCSDVCVPAREKIALLLSPDRRSPDPVIAAALEERLPVAPSVRARCTIRPRKGGFAVTARISGTAPPSREAKAVVELPGDDLWVRSVTMRPEADGFSAAAEIDDYGDGNTAIARRDIRITLLDGAASYEVRGCAP